MQENTNLKYELHENSVRFSEHVRNNGIYKNIIKSAESEASPQECKEKLTDRRGAEHRKTRRNKGNAEVLFFGIGIAV